MAPLASRPIMVSPSIPYILLFDPMETTSIQPYCWLMVVGLGRLYRVKQVFNELVRLDSNGFSNWTSRVCELANSLGLDIGQDTVHFKKNCKSTVFGNFVNNWHQKLNDLENNPILRVYTNIKCNFETSPYLNVVKKMFDTAMH